MTTHPTVEDSKEIAKYFAEMKRLSKEYLEQMEEESPDYGCIAMDLAEATVNYLSLKGEI